MHVDALGGALLVLIGSSVGVCVMALADHYSYNHTLNPQPVCVHCGRAVPPLSVMPLLGTLLTRGKCVACDGIGPWRLSFVTQVLCAYLAVALYLEYGLTDLLAIAAVEASVLMAVAVIDFQHRLIPTMLIYPTVVFALAVSPAWPNLGLLSSLEGGVLAFGIFLVLSAMARLAFGEGALGGGDVTLAALIGAICGYPMMVLALALGALFGGVGATLMVVLKRSALGTTIPYGPFLVAGVLYVIVSGGPTHPLYGVL